MPIVELSDVDLYYRQVGEGEPIVLIHHLAGSVESWEFVEEYLSSKYRIITYDLRGHGKSSVPPLTYTIEEHAKDLSRLLDYLGIDEPILIGHSIGSLIAMEYALRRPVKKLVLIGALYRSPDPIPYMKYMDIARRFGMEALALYRKTNGELPPKIVSDRELWNKFVQIYKATPIVGYLNTVRGLLESPNYENEIDKLGEFKLIYGSEDKLKTNKDIFMRAGKVDYSEIQGVGHFPNMEEPEELSRLLL
ncbi:alpha/beta fold hydrolase [Metallosphaera hakonensis]|uniref:Alpha/beta hydrolase n=1 Tax=Metallosphaera hakonensis JCM 8857 = DSM 7519 TaxID=1293036 RepID=A0A2U9IUF8_9CREN|nr:alpha/beta hydrolase [Metallosphaera hakonensis]AWR99615.1 alpha/beta fold hydrolase [Metallosphaera hakonensis JCM 8857 = DSM 7519]